MIFLHINASQLVLVNAGGRHGIRIALAEMSEGCQLLRALESLKRIVGKSAESMRSFMSGSHG